MAINTLLHKMFNIEDVLCKSIYSVEGEHYITYFSTILLLELEEMFQVSLCCTLFVLCGVFLFLFIIFVNKTYNKVKNKFIVYCCM